MKLPDKKLEEFRNLPLPNGWQICAVYVGVWWLVSVFAFSFSYQIRLIAFCFLAVFAAVCVLCIIAAEGMRWKRRLQNDDSSKPPT